MLGKELDLQFNWNARIKSHDASSSFFSLLMEGFCKGGTFCAQIEGGMMFQEQVFL